MAVFQKVPALLSGCGPRLYTTGSETPVVEAKKSNPFNLNKWAISFSVDRIVYRSFSFGWPICSGCMGYLNQRKSFGGCGPY